MFNEIDASSNWTIYYKHKGIKYYFRIQNILTIEDFIKYKKAVKESNFFELMTEEEVNENFEKGENKNGKI